MKSVFAKALVVVALLACAVPGAQADSWTFSLTPPSGAISGTPGSTIGWGYTITNQSATNWLVLVGLSADPFQNGTPDSSIFSFPILAPNSTFTATYDPVTFTGLFQLTWDPTAPVGFVNLGAFVLSAEFWDNDPFSGGNFLAAGIDQSALYSATATAPVVAPVPEPGTLLLMAGGVGAVWVRRSREKRK